MVSGRDILLWACYLNRKPQVQKLIKFTVGNLNFSTKDHNGYCPLHFAVEHNNVELVKILIANFQKYGLSVDVPDQDGLTPLLHAERLGFDAIATLLIKDGRACSQRADDKSRKNSTEWKRGGRVVRNIEKYHQKETQRVYGKKHAINVLPHIDPRGLYRTRTTLWNRSKTKHVSVHPAVAKKAYTLPVNYRRGSIERIRSVLKYQPDEKVLTIPVESEISSDDELRDILSTPEHTPRRDDQTVVASINQIMALLSDQISDSYRDPAVDKIKETLKRQKNPKNRMSVLTRINNKVKSHADEQEKRVKLKKELDRQTKILKKKNDDFETSTVSVKRDKSRIATGASREPSKVGLLPPIKVN